MKTTRIYIAVNGAIRKRRGNEENTQVQRRIFLNNIGKERESKNNEGKGYDSKTRRMKE